MTQLSKKDQFWKILTCTSRGGGVFDSPVEAFIAVTDGGSLIMAGAVWRTLGAFSDPSIRLEEARLTSWRKIKKRWRRKKPVTRG